jgi:putative ABC transport system permease protein
MERDIEREIRDHIDAATRENIDRGMPPGEARRAARLRFGNPLRIAEQTHDVWRRAWLERTLEDARHALRGLRRNPVFALAAILTLALGIGMATVVFSVVSAVLIKPLPYPDPDRLVWLAIRNQRIHFEASSAPDFADWREQSKSFEQMTAWLDVDSTVQDASESTKNAFVYITPAFWSLSGAHAALGRLFSERDRDTVVLTWKMFEQRFAADPRVVGRVVRIDGHANTIAGVLPKDFRFLLPTGDDVGLSGGIHTEAEVFAPNEITPELRSRTGGILLMFAAAKLKPGISIAAALSDLRHIQARTIRQNPSFKNFYEASEPIVIPLREKLVGQSRRLLLILLAAVAFVLLIACANFSNLLLARATSRQREIATRIAIGAGRGRMIGQFIVEGLLLAAFGGAGGIAFARVCDALLIRMSPAAVPRLAEAGIDWRVALFALGVSLLAGAIFGLAPLFSFSSRSLYAVLKDGGTHSSGSTGLRLRAALVAAEMAIALVLLTGAGLMLKSFARMYDHPASFQPETIGSMKLFLSGTAYRDPANCVTYARRLLKTLRRIPGVEALAVTSAYGHGPAQVEGMTFPPGQAPQIRERNASSGYARVVGLSLLAGRWTRDDEPTPVVMVNESFARRVLAGRNPLGQKLRIGQPPAPATIVGIVSDLKMIRLDAAVEPEILIPYQYTGTPRRVDVLFKTAQSPAAVIPEVRRAIARLDPAQPPYAAGTLENALAESIAPRRFDLLLLGAFAASAVLLALIGIYGVMSYTVARRTPEIGIRIALGARRAEIVGMIVRRAMAVAGSGVAIGILVAFGLTRLMASLLFDVKPNDAETFAAVAAVLTVTALFASWLPAVKASRIEPVRALRHE